VNGLTDTTGRPLPPIEAPSSETLRALGDMAFLALRSPRHATMTLADFRRSIEPPLMLGQYRIIRIDGVPRGMFTWALMTRAAERDYVHGAPLAATDWRSGDRLWLIDLIAPYKGMTASMVRWIMQPGNFAEREFFFRRVTQGNRTRRIVHIDFSRPEDKARILTEADFG
jgi:cytolysin-activating lysine-acyltransferase